MASPPLLRRLETGRRLTIVLDDARRHNALSTEMVAEMERALDWALDRGLAALVIEGAHGVFSAGAVRIRSSYRTTLSIQSGNWAALRGPAADARGSSPA